jgi:hypothetical protein
MASVFGRLSFPTDLNNNVTAYSNSTIKHMSVVPKLLSDWQYQDIANNNIGGYYVNPVANSANLILSISTQVFSNSSGVADIITVATSANNLVNVANNFLAHTNRLSGIVEPNADTAGLPHYSSAISVAKTVSYMCYQSDGVTNNAPIIGNFSSLYTANNLADYYTTIKTYPNIVANTIYYEADPIDPLLMIKKSNLSAGLATTIATNLNTINTYMSEKQSSDVNFFNQSNAIVADLNSVKKFSGMGETEKYLAKTLIGTDKLKARIT